MLFVWRETNYNYVKAYLELESYHVPRKCFRKGLLMEGEVSIINNQEMIMKCWNKLVIIIVIIIIIIIIIVIIIIIIIIIIINHKTFVVSLLVLYCSKTTKKVVSKCSVGVCWAAVPTWQARTQLFRRGGGVHFKLDRTSCQQSLKYISLYNTGGAPFSTEKRNIFLCT